jgi:hypothetical protein
MKTVIHIGPVKTGSTALATYFGMADKEGLLPMNLTFPSGDLWFGMTKHSGPQLHQTLDSTSEDASSFFAPDVEQTMQRIVDVARSRSGEDSTVIFIAETATGIPHPSELTTRLSRHFSDITYVMSARRQDAAVASRMTQGVKSRIDNGRNSLELADFLGAAKNFMVSFDYAHQFTKWKPAADEHKLVVLPYLEGASDPYLVVDLFAQALGEKVELPRIPQFAQMRANSAPSEEALSELVALEQRFAEAVDTDPAVADALREDFRRLKAAQSKKKSAMKGGARNAKWQLDSRDAFLLLSAFAGSNLSLLDAMRDSALDEYWTQWGLDLAKRTAQLRKATTKPLGEDTPVP